MSNAYAVPTPPPSPRPVSRMEHLFGEIKSALADNDGAIIELHDATRLVSMPLPPVTGAQGAQPAAQAPGSFLVGELDAILTTIRTHTAAIKAITQSLEV